MGQYVGVDLALKGQHEACLEAASGQIKRFRFSNVPAEIVRFFEWVKKQEMEVAGFVMEPTGAAWIPLARFLAGEGYPVFLLKSEKAHDLRKFYRKHTKSDSIDALTLAKVPVVDPRGVFPYEFPDANRDLLKRLVKIRQRLVESIALRKRRIQATLDVLLPGWRQKFAGKQMMGEIGRTFLREFADLRKAKALGFDAFAKKLASASHAGREKIRPLHVLIVEACEFHEKTIGLSNLDLFYAGRVEEIHVELSLMENEKSELTKIEKEVQEAYAKADPRDTLGSHVGIGPGLAPTILAYSGNLKRFSNVREFRAFCGLCPRQQQSGTHEVLGLPMTKAGPALLKHAFYLSGNAARRFDPEFALTYDRMRKRGKHHNRILGALATKMATRVFSVLRRQGDLSSEAQPYVLRDLQGEPIAGKEAFALIRQTFGKNLKEARKKEAEERLKAEAVLKDASRCMEASTCSKAQSLRSYVAT